MNGEFFVIYPPASENSFTRMDRKKFSFTRMDRQKVGHTPVLIYACLAQGTSKYRCGPLTLHTQTAIHVAQLMTKVISRFAIASFRKAETEAWHTIRFQMRDVYWT